MSLQKEYSPAGTSFSLVIVILDLYPLKLPNICVFASKYMINTYSNSGKPIKSHYHLGGNLSLLPITKIIQL